MNFKVESKVLTSPHLLLQDYNMDTGNPLHIYVHVFRRLMFCSALCNTLCWCLLCSMQTVFNTIHICTRSCIVRCTFIKKKMYCEMYVFLTHKFVTQCWACLINESHSAQWLTLILSINSLKISACG